MRSLFPLVYQLVDHLLHICPAVAEHVQHVHHADPHWGVLELLLEQEEVVLLLASSLVHECPWKMLLLLMCLCSDYATHRTSVWLRESFKMKNNIKSKFLNSVKSATHFLSASWFFTKFFVFSDKSLSTTSFSLLYFSARFSQTPEKYQIKSQQF